MSIRIRLRPHLSRRARPRPQGPQARGTRAALTRPEKTRSKKVEEEGSKQVVEGSGEAGEATVEFIGVMMILVIPVFYLIITLGSLQSALYAAEASARNAVRIVANNPQQQEAARLQGYLTFQDYNIAAAPDIHVSCQPAHCQAGGSVEVFVATSVPLPLLPDWLSGGLSIPVEAQANMPIAGVELR